MSNRCVPIIVEAFLIFARRVRAADRRMSDLAAGGLARNAAEWARHYQTSPNDAAHTQQHAAATRNIAPHPAEEIIRSYFRAKYAATIDGPCGVRQDARDALRAASLPEAQASARKQRQHPTMPARLRSYRSEDENLGCQTPRHAHLLISNGVTAIALTPSPNRPRSRMREKSFADLFPYAAGANLSPSQGESVSHACGLLG